MATEALLSNGKRAREGDDGPQAPHKRGARPGQPVHPPGLEVPDGWLECPPMGAPMDKISVVPTKVPLGRRFNSVIPERRQFTPQMLVEQLARRNIQVGMVIDLTNTWRYYDAHEWEALDVAHVKIHCRGRGKPPDPEAVNLFCWRLMNFLQYIDRRGKYAIVHCTHGYNRTGYMLASFLSRQERKPLPAAVKTFATHRVPGIYKDNYLAELFDYNHYKRGKEVATPALPEWKSVEEAESDAEEEAPVTEPVEPPEMKHDDKFGEELCEEEADMVRQCIVMGMRGKAEHELDWHSRPHFPGSQPVSLDKVNLALLAERRYWVTWKADGTRYMLLLCQWGTYLVDRSFEVRRIQMRFPRSKGKPEPGPHHFTLLDGEMVVDSNMETDTLRRRFLIYDLMLDNSASVAALPFSDRFKLIDKEVVRPRLEERAAFDSPKAKFVYLYQQEPFSVQRKGFWPLAEAGKVLDMIPNLSHEADGLILQGYEDPYVNGTCQELLKWKFAHLNSVDFQLLFDDAGQQQLVLLETRNKSRTLTPLKGSRLIIPGGQPARELENAIIECSFDPEEKAWVYMRTRNDKDTPNAFHVYEKVLRSIQDNIDAEFLLSRIGEAVKGAVYAPDRAARR